MGIHYMPSIMAMFNKKAMMIWVMGYYFFNDVAYLCIKLSLRRRNYSLTIDSPIDGTFFESHDVLSESSCFVGENIFNLAQFFIECGRPGFGRHGFGSVIHLPVPVYKITVSQTDYFHAVVR